ncbi:MAG: alpha/beta hydrolase family protein [Candidatus Rokuibacteriota bacterium]
MASESPLPIEVATECRGRAPACQRGRSCPGINLATEPPSIFFKADPARITRWAEFLDRNTPRAERVHFPLFVFQGESDTVVNPEFTDAFVARLCRSGNAVLYKKYPGEDHVGAISAARTDFLDWMRDRLIGKSPDANCGAPR